MIKEIQEGLRPHKARHLQFQENINHLSVETIRLQMFYSLEG